LGLFIAEHRSSRRQEAQIKTENLYEPRNLGCYEI